MQKKKFVNSNLRGQLKNKNAFTLIELLAIIVILAIIAVITVPLILNIINDSKKGAAKDNSYGYKKGIENFYLSKFSENQSFKFEDRAYTTEELKNLGLQVSGQEPNGGEVVFEDNRIKSFILEYDKFICDYSVDSEVSCSDNAGLVIKSIKHESTTDSISVTVDIYGTATSYEYKINDGEFDSSNLNTYTFSNLNDEVEYEITIKVKGDSGEISKNIKIRTQSLEVGDAIVYGGYNWHVIRNYTEDGQQYQTLLMDSGQLEDMVHCTNDRDASTDCGTFFAGFTKNLYSWDKSLIQTYLNTTFIEDLQSRGVNINELKTEQICVDSSTGGSNSFSYGGYLKKEVDELGGSCSNYGSYKIRLITASEYINLTYKYIDMILPFEGNINNSGSIFKITKLDGIRRLSSDESILWLYSSDIGRWWTMTSVSSPAASHDLIYTIETDGNISTNYNESVLRPVITIIK